MPRATGEIAALHKKVNVVCPDCGEEREVQESSTKQPRFTGRCAKCSLKAAKKAGWSKTGAEYANLRVK